MGTTPPGAVAQVHRRAGVSPDAALAVTVRSGKTRLSGTRMQRVRQWQGATRHVGRKVSQEKTKKESMNWTGDGKLTPRSKVQSTYGAPRR
ncbi:hypothetical protein C2845_PM15G05510 [Panicum miliaceum]|uniref:Uncharacterized protein n=1 Tax=Panicum miliaceum TaxID=4540 RepID=A0A3L6QBB3_PANMI|nr:hypothetical protein C2845_PM15G05510 [Panicum miliaceum]